MNQNELIESAHEQLSLAHGALVSAHQPALATRTGQTVDILGGDTPDAFGARQHVQALEKELLPMLQKHSGRVPAELQNALTALRTAEQQLTAALGAQHRSEG